MPSSRNDSQQVISFGPIETRIHETVTGRGGCLCVLFDPDKNSPEELSHAAEACQEGGTDFIFIGSSLMLSDNFDVAVKAVKKGCDLPVVIFPGHSSQVTGEADAILFLSLISGRNAEYLIGQHVIAAPVIHNLGLEVIPTGYMLIDSGKITSVQFMSMTAPMPRNKTDIVVAHALAAKFLGMRLLYLEGGSGGEFDVPEELISEVVGTVELPLIVGGGIRNPETARMKIEAGASCIVMGNCLEDSWSPERVREFSDAVHVT